MRAGYHPGSSLMMMPWRSKYEDYKAGVVNRMFQHMTGSGVLEKGLMPLEGIKRTDAALNR